MEKEIRAKAEDRRAKAEDGRAKAEDRRAKAMCMEAADFLLCLGHVLRRRIR